MAAAHLELALRLDAAARLWVRRMPRKRRREEMAELVRQIRAVLLEPPPVIAPAPADPLAAFVSAAEAARDAGFSAPELIDAFNDVLERCAAPAPKR